MDVHTSLRPTKLVCPKYVTQHAATTPRSRLHEGLQTMMWRNLSGERYPNWIHIPGVFRSGLQGTGAAFRYDFVKLYEREWIPMTPLACRLFTRTMMRAVDDP